MSAAAMPRRHDAATRRAAAADALFAADR